MNARLRWIRNKLSALNLDGMIVSNPINIRYLTGITAEGVLLITRKENIFLTDGRYIEEVHSILTIDDEIIVYDVIGLCQDDYENFFLFCENVGFEESYITYAKYKEYKQKYKINNFVETEGIFEKQRMIKDEDEIECIKKACAITDSCFEYLLKYIKKGMTEKQIAQEISNYFILNGAEGTSFDPIVASGINTSKPHAIPTDKKIESGDIIVIDIGCKYKGYCSDMTRTIFVDFIQDYIKPVYELVLKNQINTIKDAKDNYNSKVLAKMVENDFKQNRFDLIHALGHGVGLDIHEYPIIGTRTELMLKENMVITDEPGIYIPGKFGIRIEDTMLITKFGSEALTKFSKEIIVI